MVEPSDLMTSPWRRKLRDLFGIDVRSLAAMRIAVAVILLVDLVLRAPYIDANYTDGGVLPRVIASLFNLPIFPHLLGGSYGYALFIFLVSAVFAVSMLIGWHTRVAVLASWILLTSLHARNPALLNGGDRLLRALLLWCVFLPMGACWSVDARRWGGGVERRSVLSPASVALLLQFVFVYTFAGLVRTDPAWHRDGTAIELALRYEYWARPFGLYVAQFSDVLRFITPVSLWFEIIGPLVLFLPFRTAAVRLVMIAAFWLFSLSMGISIQLHLFPWITAVAALPFLPSAFWDKLRWPGRPASSSAAPDASPAPRIPVCLWRDRAQHGLVLVLLLYVLASNVQTIRAPDQPRPLLNAGGALLIDQNWTMYLRAPRITIWFELVGVADDGTTIRLDHVDQPSRWRDTMRHYRSNRFKICLSGFLEPDKVTRARVQRYLFWLCRQWHGAGPHERQITHIRLYLHRRWLMAHRSRPIKSELLGELSCHLEE